MGGDGLHPHKVPQRAEAFTQGGSGGQDDTTITEVVFIHVGQAGQREQRDRGVGLGQLKRMQGETEKRAVYQALDEETCRV